MNEPCGVCGRPKGDRHRYPVAGECTAPDPTDHTVFVQCLSIALQNARADVKAAEERGRRRGVEEAIAIASGFGTFGQGLVKQLRTLLREDAEPPKKATIAELEAILALPDDALEVYVLPNGEVRARPRMALAPRDSGKVEP